MISPFSRLWLLLGGRAVVRHHGRRFVLEPGYVHLVPPFVAHDCSCSRKLDHYHLPFVARVPAGVDLFSLLDVPFQLLASVQTRKHFQRLVAQHLGLPSQICIYSENCGKGVAVENDGSVYACDHYVYPEYRLGSVKTGRLDEMVFSPEQVKFGSAKSANLPQYCRQCAFLADCRGECPKNRLIRTPDGGPGLNHLCRGFKKFFAHAMPEVQRIAARLSQ